MSLGRRVNGSPATGTRNRIGDVVAQSGICAACLDGCTGTCEVGRSTLRGREMLYPEPYGKVTAGATKDYPVDYSHLNIMGTCVGAQGMDADSDQAVFPAVKIGTEIGTNRKIKMRVPVFTGALGSTDIARINWAPTAIGAAISGIGVVIGENVCGMDPAAEFRNGRVVKSPEMERRIKAYLDWYEGEGAIVVQYNVEDGRLGVPELALQLGAHAIEAKWGQGAKDIGGEVKLPSVERAAQLKSRGYIVYPDPSDKVVQSAFVDHEFSEFERHSRLGMASEEGFYRDIERLRKAGAEIITLKTGAYRPADLALAMKVASESKIDLITIDGAGGGTGMSPWRMMNEWGVPTLYLQSLAHKMACRLEAKGKFVPSMAIAGGFSLEDHVFKAIALGAPFVKAVCMGRATMIPAMVGKNIQQWMAEKTMPKEFDQWGHTVEQLFVDAAKLKARFGSRFEELPVGAIGMYTYLDRIATGLQQLMAGARKFRLDLVGRDDLVSLTRECTDVTGITYVMDVDSVAIDAILDGTAKALI